MTIRIVSGDGDPNQQYAIKLEEHLKTINPALERPDIKVAIVTSFSGIGYPKKTNEIKEADLLLIYENCGEEREQDSPYTNIKSFILVIEVKEWTSNNFRWEIEKHTNSENFYIKALYRYQNQLFESDAFSQNFEQREELKSYLRPKVEKQKYTLKAEEGLKAEGYAKTACYLHAWNTVWFCNEPKEPHSPFKNPGDKKEAFVEINKKSLFRDFGWLDLLNQLPKHKQIQIKNLDFPLEITYDDILETLKTPNHYSVLEQKKIDIVTASKLDDDKIDNLMDKEILILAGRAGTGKTFKLLKIAINRLKKGEPVIFVTYNRALVSEITRLIHHYRAKKVVQSFINFPKMLTTYELIKQLAAHFVSEEYKSINKEYTRENSLDYLKFRKQAYLHALEKKYKPFKSETKDSKTLQHRDDAKEVLKHYYFLLDEGHDVSKDERNIIGCLFDYKKIVVGDGIDQFAEGRGARIEWKLGLKQGKPKYLELPFKVSLRSKTELVEFTGEFARKLDVEWDIIKSDYLEGGKITVIETSEVKLAIDESIACHEESIKEYPDNKPIDNLWLFPNKHTYYGEQFEEFAKEKKIKYWGGTNYNVRSEPVEDIEQYRLLHYESARGIEGFSVICLGLDSYYSLRQNAENWVMIALSRASNHLIIHITNRNSTIGSILREMYDDKIHESGKSKFLIDWKTI